MSDLISREKAVAELYKLSDTMIKEGHHQMALGVNDSIMVVGELMPTAQPKRKNGKWHQRFYSQIEMMVCSECNSEFSYDAETGVSDYNFCPNCGAKMEVEHENNHVHL